MTASALYQRIKRQILAKVVLVRIALVILVVAAIAGLYSGIIRPVVNRVAPLIKAAQQNLPTHAGRTNFLLLGIAGGGHAGADLTDTLIVVSIDAVKKDVAVLSIPRDIWVPSMRAKINTAYYYGYQKEGVTGGIQLAKSAIGEIIDLPIDYVAIIDFSGFEKIIDLLGGVDVEVERAFEDHNYPIAGREDDLCEGDPEYRCRYELLSFQAGSQHMNGATALKFARSRQAEGEEGTDFARSARQEKIMLAVRDRLLSREILTKPTKLQQLYATVVASVKTDVGSELYPALTKLALGLAQVDPRTSSLAASELLINPPTSAVYDFQWVLIPKDGEWSILADYVTRFLSP